jgi:hypothetical protein
VTAAPGETSVVTPGASTSLRSQLRSPGRWMTLSGAADFAGQSAIGVRAEIDMIGGDFWSAGIHGAYYSNGNDANGYKGSTTLGGVFLAASAGHGPWDLRLSGGIGVAGTSREAYWGSEERAARLVGSGAITISREIVQGWGLAAGVAGDTRYADGDSADGVLMAFAGIRRRM